MRIVALILSVLFGVSAISMADAAPKKAAKPPAEKDLNADSKKLLWDGMPLIMPQAVMLWMLHNKEVEAKEAKAKTTKTAKVAKPKPQ